MINHFQQPPRDADQKTRRRFAQQLRRFKEAHGRDPAIDEPLREKDRQVWLQNNSVTITETLGTPSLQVPSTQHPSSALPNVTEGTFYPYLTPIDSSSTQLKNAPTTTSISNLDPPHPTSPTSTQRKNSGVFPIRSSPRHDVSISVQQEGSDEYMSAVSGAEEPTPPSANTSKTRRKRLNLPDESDHATNKRPRSVIEDAQPGISTPPSRPSSSGSNPAGLYSRQATLRAISDDLASGGQEYGRQEHEEFIHIDTFESDLQNSPRRPQTSGSALNIDDDQISCVANPKDTAFAIIQPTVHQDTPLSPILSRADFFKAFQKPAPSALPYSFADYDAPLPPEGSVGSESWSPITSDSSLQCQTPDRTNRLGADPRIFDLIQHSMRFDGCTCTQGGPSHEGQRRGGTGTYTLRKMASYWQITHQVPDILQILQQQRRLPRFSPQAIRAVNWRAILAGIEDRFGRSDPLKLSLGRSESSTQPKICRKYDIDAAIFPLTSLAALKHGITIDFYPSYTRTISNSWHTPITPQGIIPRECKHLRIGRGRGSADFDLYVFFPNMPLTPGARGPDKYRAQCYVTASEQATWVDEILIPALQQVCEEDVWGHICRSFAEAKSRAWARPSTSITGAEKHRSETGYFIHNLNDSTTDPPPLERLWNSILQLIHPQSPLAQPELVLVTYGTKLVWRGPTLRQLQATFAQDTNRQFAVEHINFDYAIVDLAYEDFAENESNTGKSYVLLRKSACNQEDIVQLELQKREQEFQWFGTTDASTIRAEPNKTSHHRSGGLAYMQAYNVIKDLFVSPDRSAGPLFAQDSLPFLTYTRKTFAELAKMAKDSRAYSLTRIDKIADSFKSTIIGLDSTLRSSSQSPNGFGVRQEYRVSYQLFIALTLPTRQPSIANARPASEDGSEEDTPEDAEGAHWPYYILDKGEVLEYIRWQLNRWLFAICAVISIPQAVGTSGQEVTSITRQQCYTATCSAFFSCLRVIANSECVALTNRVALATYHRPPERLATQEASINDLWRISKAEVKPTRTANATQATTRVRNTYASATQDGTLVFRRGLALMDSLNQTNMVWLQDDMFDWERLCFIEEVLVDTAFAAAEYRSLYQSKLSTNQDECVRRVMSRALVGLTPDLFIGEVTADTANRMNIAALTLWNLCIFGYTHDILGRLTHYKKRPTSDRLPHFWSEDVTDDERRGFHGLTYGLVCRMSGEPPILSWSRAANANHVAGSRSFGDFPLTWESRLEILFDHKNNFKRTNWESARWRGWFETCYDRLVDNVGFSMAEKWRTNFPSYAATKLNILPRFEADKHFQMEKIPQNISTDLKNKRRERRGLKWQAAIPIMKGGPDPTSRQQEVDRWQMLIWDNGVKTRDALPAIWARESQRHLVNGERLRYIDDLIGADDVEMES